MDLPSKIVLPHIAEAVRQADPDEIFTHIQVVTASPTLTYNVLWLKAHWLESAERQRVKFFNSLQDRATLTAKNAWCERMDLIVKRFTAIGIPAKEAERCIHRQWKAARDEAAFKAAIDYLGVSFNYPSLYEAPNENEIKENTASTDPDSEEAEPV